MSNPRKKLQKTLLGGKAIEILTPEEKFVLEIGEEKKGQVALFGQKVGLTKKEQERVEKFREREKKKRLPARIRRLRKEQQKIRKQLEKPTFKRRGQVPLPTEITKPGQTLICDIVKETKEKTVIACIPPEPED